MESRLLSFYARHPRPRHRHAFTLIELLVVVAIIALLLSILLASLGRAKAHARTVVCLTHLRAIGQGFGAYSTEFSNQLPAPFLTLLPRDTGLPATVNESWQIPLWVYTTHIDLTNQQILAYSASTTSTSTFLLNTVFICPQGILNPRSTNFANCSYAMNSDLPDAPLDSKTAAASPWNRYKRLQPLINQSATMFAADGDQYNVNVNITGNKSIDVFGGATGASATGSSGAVFDDVALTTAQNRHNLCVNVLMGDGSAGTKAWVNNREIPSYLSGDAVPTSAALMSPDIQLFWFGTYSPGGEFIAPSL